MDPELEAWLAELKTDIVNRHATIGDIAHDSYIAAKCEMMNSKPDLAYVRRILSLARDNPLNLDPKLMAAYRRRQVWKGLDS